MMYLQSLRGFSSNFDAMILPIQDTWRMCMTMWVDLQDVQVSTLQPNKRSLWKCRGWWLDVHSHVDDYQALHANGDYEQYTFSSYLEFQRPSKRCSLNSFIDVVMPCSCRYCLGFVLYLHWIQNVSHVASFWCKPRCSVLSTTYLLRLEQCLHFCREHRKFYGISHAKCYLLRHHVHNMLILGQAWQCWV